MSDPEASKVSPWSLLLGVAILGAIAVQSVWGFPALLLYFAACALLLVVILMWSSLQRMGLKESLSFEEAMSLKAPSATEEQKRAALRTLKDLDYELHVGKISQEDFDQVSREVRDRAKRLIAAQDEDMGERLELAQKRVDSYLKERAEDLK